MDTRFVGTTLTAFITDERWGTRLQQLHIQVDHRSPLTRAGTRALDLAIGFVGLVLTTPVVVAAAIGAALALRTSPLFVQERIGLAGQRFRVAKIRTLPRTVPRDIDKYALGDHRVPRFTQWLRNLHLDELPQLLCVIGGSMSLVGPRPEIPSLHDEITSEAAAIRERVRPGCSGLWQLSPAGDGLIHEASEYDTFYVANQTVRLDLWILYRTALFLVLRRRHTTLDDIPAWTIRPLRRSTVVHSAAPLGSAAD